MPAARSRTTGPAEPLRLPAGLREFLREETAGGAVLVIAALVVAWVNSPWRESYDTLWATRPPGS
jgi:Na+/H+ antiporter NhaA